MAFCRTCVISNQRPNSTIEQKHTRETKKEVIAFKNLYAFMATAEPGDSVELLFTLDGAPAAPAA